MAVRAGGSCAGLDAVLCNWGELRVPSESQGEDLLACASSLGPHLLDKALLALGTCSSFELDLRLEALASGGACAHNNSSSSSSKEFRLPVLPFWRSSRPFHDPWPPTSRGPVDAERALELFAFGLAAGLACLVGVADLAAPFPRAALLPEAAFGVLGDGI